MANLIKQHDLGRELHERFDPHKAGCWTGRIENFCAGYTSVAFEGLCHESQRQLASLIERHCVLEEAYRQSLRSKQ